jgi:hypothetical protein
MFAVDEKTSRKLSTGLQLESYGQDELPFFLKLSAAPISIHSYCVSNLHEADLKTENGRRDRWELQETVFRGYCC